ncbi:MAG: hypothetical protein H6622_09805 [Halobacteriovoraceae bacterium]|nr:hypothetical protein [Halobacteriovoraceae bacterium]
MKKTILLIFFLNSQLLSDESVITGAGVGNFYKTVKQSIKNHNDEVLENLSQKEKENERQINAETHTLYLLGHQASQKVEQGKELTSEDVKILVKNIGDIFAWELSKNLNTLNWNKLADPSVQNANTTIQTDDPHIAVDSILDFEVAAFETLEATESGCNSNLVIYGENQSVNDFFENQSNVVILKDLPINPLISARLNLIFSQLNLGKIYFKSNEGNYVEVTIHNNQIKIRTIVDFIQKNNPHDLRSKIELPTLGINKSKIDLDKNLNQSSKSKLLAGHFDFSVNSPNMLELTEGDLIEKLTSIEGSVKLEKDGNFIFGSSGFRVECKVENNCDLNSFADIVRNFKSFSFFKFGGKANDASVNIEATTQNDKLVTANYGNTQVEGNFDGKMIIKNNGDYSFLGEDVKIMLKGDITNDMISNLSMERKIGEDGKVSVNYEHQKSISISLEQKNVLNGKCSVINTIFEGEDQTVAIFTDGSIQKGNGFGGSISADCKF